jgi:hypothetical protein
MFGGPRDRRTVGPVVSRYSDSRIYAEPSDLLIQQLRTMGSMLESENLFRRIRRIPDLWEDAALTERLRITVERLSTAREVNRIVDSLMETQIANVRFYPQVRSTGTYPVLRCSVRCPGTR